MPPGSKEAKVDKIRKINQNLQRAILYKALQLLGKVFSSNSEKNAKLLEDFEQRGNRSIT